MKKCLRIVLSAYYAGQWTKEERRCFLSSIYGGCKRGNTEWKKTGLKYRERNEEKLRADARSTERNLYKPNRISKIYTSYYNNRLV